MKNYAPNAILRELTKGPSMRKGLILMLLLALYALWLPGKAFAVGSWKKMREKKTAK